MINYDELESECFDSMKEILDTHLGEGGKFDLFLGKYSLKVILRTLVSKRDDPYWENDLPRESVAPMVRGASERHVLEWDKAPIREYVDFMQETALDESQPLAVRELCFAGAFHLNLYANKDTSHPIHLFRDLSGAWIRPMLRLADAGELFPKYALLATLKTAESIESGEPDHSHFHAMLHLMEEYRIKLGLGKHVYDKMPEKYITLLDTIGVRH